MACDLAPAELLRYLEGKLPQAAATAVELHLGRCESCQAEALLPAEFAAMLQARLPAPPVPAALARQLHAAHSPLPRAEAFPSSAESRFPWRRWLASPWTPRLAMAAVVAVLLLIPARGFWKAPAVAQEAATRHAGHLPFWGGPMPGCCQDLRLAVGAILDAPSAGERIPDLGAVGLDFVAATRCTGPTTVNLICYRTAAGEFFSLYMSDQVAEQFQAHPRRPGEPSRYRVQDSDVTLWARNGFLYQWVGPHGSSAYDQALALLHGPESTGWRPSQ